MKYQGECALVAIEAVPATTDQSNDSVALVARYRPGRGAPAAQSPWAIKFQVARARVHDLQLHLQSHPTVLCDPGGHQASLGEPYRIEVPPFEGQRGQPIDLRPRSD